VICFANCPIIWSSKLQTDIATSTLEAEYNALSMAMKYHIPLKRLVQTVSSSIGLSKETITTFNTTVWEHNVGKLTLAKMEPGRTTPRSKFYAVKYHWFHSHLKPKFIEIEKIELESQKFQKNEKITLWLVNFRWYLFSLDCEESIIIRDDLEGLRCTTRSEQQILNSN